MEARGEEARFNIAVWFGEGEGKEREGGGGGGGEKRGSLPLI